MALPDSYTIHKMEMTPESNGSVCITMKAGPKVGDCLLTSRVGARSVILELCLTCPPWLYPENDDD